MDDLVCLLIPHLLTVLTHIIMYKNFKNTIILIYQTFYRFLGEIKKPRYRPTHGYKPTFRPVPWGGLITRVDCIFVLFDQNF